MTNESVWTSLIGWLFLIANSGRLLAYLPQIVAAARCDAGAKSVSILTWGYFAFAHLTALLYALFVLGDEKSVWIFSGNLIVTLVLVAIVGWKRRRYLCSRLQCPVAGVSAVRNRDAMLCGTEQLFVERQESLP